MIKKALLIVIIALYAGTASAGIVQLSFALYGETFYTACVEGYVFVVKNKGFKQVLGSDGDPLTCKGEVHPSIGK